VRVITKPTTPWSRRILVLAIALAGVLLAPGAAEACACCDAGFTRTPVGWSEAGGAVLVDMDTDVACEPRRALEIWRIGDTEPSACFDLHGDPDKRIACEDVETPPHPRKPPRRGSRAPKAFPRQATKLPADRVRVLTTRTSGQPDQRRIAVSVERDGSWKRVWSGTVEPVGGRVEAAVWPNPRGDRALLVIQYRMVGTNNQAADVTWIQL
jgi:hypothetical protein